MDCKSLATGLALTGIPKRKVLSEQNKAIFKSLATE
jgi:hypothetical protein